MKHYIATFRGDRESLPSEFYFTSDYGHFTDTELAKVIVDSTDIPVTNDHLIIEKVEEVSAEEFVRRRDDDTPTLGGTYRFVEQ